jgi:hypothetical protein
MMKGRPPKVYLDNFVRYEKEEKKDQRKNNLLFIVIMILIIGIPVMIKMFLGG